MTSIVLVLLFLRAGVALNFAILPIQTAPFCVMRTVMSTPSGIGNEPILIDRLAWPIGSQVFSPLTINGQAPITTEPELLCMGGCPNPPCWPVLTCPVADLYWSHLYDVVVPANSQMELPDMPQGMVPPSLFVLYDGVPLPPSPLPSRSPSMTASPSPVPSMTASQTPTPTPSTSNHAQVAAAPVLAESPHATPAAIVFGLLFGAVSLILVYCWRQQQFLTCPYCDAKNTGAVGLRNHLKTCQDHLALYQPFVAESVQTVRLPTHAWSERRESSTVLVELMSENTEPPGAVEERREDD